MSMGDLVTRNYNSFRGVDFRGEEVNLVRSPDALNMWKDYKETEMIKTRPELELQEEFETPVWGIFFYEIGNREIWLIHSGTTLYKIEDGVSTELYEGLNPVQSSSFIYNTIWYFKDGINYLQYDGDTIKEVVGYVPTTSIGRKPAGGGSTYEDVNMLSALRKNTFLADGESVDYYLDAQELDTGVEVVVTVNGVIVDNYTVDEVHGKITFDVAPEAPLTDGQDNVSVLFQKTISEHRQRINGCTLLQVFDNRVFFSGNPDYPNVVWHSSLNDPTYCSDLDYYNEGLDLARVTGLVVGADALYVLKEPSQANTAVFYHQPVTDSAYGKIYPSTHSSIYTGCVGKCINFNDDVVFFSDRGMEAISGGINTEQMLAHRSTLIDSRLLTEENYKDMLLEEYEGYLMVFVDSRVYLADSRATFDNENHTEYEWFLWDLNKKVTSTKVYKGMLYIGTEDGIYTLSDTKSSVVSYWTTPIDKFKHPQYMKTTNKKGCVVEAYGDVSISVKTDKSDWIGIGDYKDVKDYLVCRIKQKKFKDIQMKFSSDTRFSLETATLECYIGGYIKR